jgi:hypothetical protein
MKDYARRVGADFYVIDRRLGSAERPPHFEKLQARYLLDVYDRVLFLDTDIAVQRNAPDVFEAVPPGEFGGYDELGRVGRAYDAKTTLWEWLIFRAACPAAVRFYHPADVYLNAGVMVFDRSHRSLFRDPPRGCWSFLFPEQTYINFLIRCEGTKIARLSPRFNYMAGYMGNPVPARFPVYFYHVIGCETKDRFSLLRRLGC